MTINELCREAVGAMIASHYNPHWTVIIYKWVAFHVVAIAVALRSKF